MSGNWKKYVLVIADLLLVAYLACAFTVFNKPDETMRVCTKANFTVLDDISDGFIDTAVVIRRLKEHDLYPLGMQMSRINSRRIEEVLKSTPFVKSAECYKTNDGEVYVTITQLTPIVRVKADSGDDYYIDDKDCIMPNSAYTSDLIIATGHISRWFARRYVSPFARCLMENPVGRNLVVQINVLPDYSIEVVPRVGNHIVCLGRLPEVADRSKRLAAIKAFTDHKIERLVKFYKFGLAQVGWNKYSYIDLEFDNQIVCRRHGAHLSAASPSAQTQPVVAQPAADAASTPQQQSQVSQPVAQPRPAAQPQAPAAAASTARPKGVDSKSKKSDSASKKSDGASKKSDSASKKSDSASKKSDSTPKKESTAKQKDSKPSKSQGTKTDNTARKQKSSGPGRKSSDASQKSGNTGSSASRAAKPVKKSS